MLKGFNRRRKLLGLHVRRAQEVPRVGVFRVNLGHTLKGIDRRLRVARVLVHQPEVVPRVRTLGINLQRFFERGLGFIHLLQVQVRDTHVQPRNRQLRISFSSLFEEIQSLLEQLLVHVGGSKIIQARRFNGVRLRCGCKQTKRGQERCDKRGRDFQIHLVNDLTTEAQRNTADGLTSRRACGAA